MLLKVDTKPKHDKKPAPVKAHVKKPAVKKSAEKPETKGEFSNLPRSHFSGKRTTVVCNARAKFYFQTVHSR